MSRVPEPEQIHPNHLRYTFDCEEDVDVWLEVDVTADSVLLEVQNDSIVCLLEKETVLSLIETLQTSLERLS